MNGQSGLLIDDQQIFILIQHIQVRLDLGKEGILALRTDEQFVVQINLQHVARSQPRVGRGVAAVQSKFLLAIEFLALSHTDGGHFTRQPFIQLASVVRSGDDEFLQLNHFPHSLLLQL